jgi:hypothetical protein
MLGLAGSALADGFINLSDFSGGESLIDFNTTDMGGLSSPTADIGMGVLVTNSGGGTGGPNWIGNVDWGSYFSNIPGNSGGRALADGWGSSDLLFDMTGAGNPTRVGMLLSTGVQTTFDIEVYGPANNLIDSGSFTMPAASQAVFVGYEASGGVGYFRVMDVENGNISLLDDVRFESVGGYRLRLSGSCPGQVQVAWSGGTPNRVQGLVFGQNLGSTTIPNQYPCAGTVLGVSGQVRLVDPPGFFSNQGGSGSINGNAGTAACGRYLQLVEGGTCQTSNVAQIP